MANEAVRVSLMGNGGDVMEMSCADGTTIEKYTLLKLSGNRTVAASSGASDIFAGIAASEKVAGDGSTTIGVYTNGVFDLTCIAGAGVTAGARVSLSGANLIKDATEAEIASGKDFGVALETGSASEVIEVRVLYG